MHFEVAVVISAECVAGEADPLFFFLPLLFFLCLVSGDGEACGGGAGRPDSHSGPGTRPAHLPEQRGPRHPGRLGGSLAPRPAALPASQWPPAQPPAQRQHAQLPERWVRRSRRSQPPDSLDGTFSPHRVTLWFYYSSGGWWRRHCWHFSALSALRLRLSVRKALPFRNLLFQRESCHCFYPLTCLSEQLMTSEPPN